MGGRNSDGWKESLALCLLFGVMYPGKGYEMADSRWEGDGGDCGDVARKWPENV